MSADEDDIKATTDRAFLSVAVSERANQHSRSVHQLTWVSADDRSGRYARRSPRRVFRDRAGPAGCWQEILAAYRDQPDVIVLGLARGGLPVAWEVAGTACR